MQAYIKGDLEGFQLLYQRYKGRVLGYLNSRLPSQDEAEEVFQDVFAKLHSCRLKYKPEIPFIAWLFTIVKHTLIDYLRKRGTQSKYLQLDPEKISNAPDESLVSLSIAETISELSSLSRKQRQALEFRFNDDLSFTDIAARMNTSHANARQIVSRAIRQLRGLMSSKEL